ncbi:MAG: hypothetical protein PWR30_395 [Candidatus Woesearchaeota archaeon]|nr:hypothetical protein [Candidatus Woesearchaeota archaeon]
MKAMNKKGVSHIIADVVLVVITLAIAIPTIAQQTIMTVEDNTQQCKMSMQASSVLENSPGDNIVIQCRPDFISIGTNYVTRNGYYEEIDGKRRYEEEDVDDVIKEIISMEMARCWTIADQGKANPYNEKTLDDVACLICSKIHFEEDFGNISGIYEYMQNHNVPSSDTTYADFILKNSGDSKDAEHAYIGWHSIISNISEETEKEASSFWGQFWTGESTTRITAIRDELIANQIKNDPVIETNKDYYVMNIQYMSTGDLITPRESSIVVLPVEEAPLVCGKIVN